MHLGEINGEFNADQKKKIGYKFFGEFFFQNTHNMSQASC